MDSLSSSSLQPKLLNNVRQVIDNARGQVYRAVNSAMVRAYWEIGRLIVEDEQQGQLRAEYGKRLLTELAHQLTVDYGKGFESRELRKMRQFYLSFPIRDAVRPELPWTHYRSLIRVENAKAREWYMNESVAAGWSSRALDRQISTMYYERLLASRDKAPVENEAVEKTTELIDDPRQVLKDPYILDFLGLEHQQKMTEHEVETAILTHLQGFLLEMGRGFAFVARQQHIRTDLSDHYLDLVFYNFQLKCFVIIDLKVGKLTAGDVGQMDMYVRMYDHLHRTEGDNPTIGLILCSEPDQAVARYSVLADNKQLFASRYMKYLPTEEELARLLEQDRHLWESAKMESAEQG